MSFIVGLDHVTIQIDEGGEALTNALHFYVDLLGLTPLDRPANTDNGRPGAWLRCGPAQQLHIITGAGATAENRASRRHPAFHVSDLEALRKRLVAAGVEILAGNRFPGQERFFVRDPFGNRLEFVTRTMSRDAP
ncbi:MAG TPA: VOC family protein [Candidatus Binataceae bacterium]|jgi:catechol 2,3-dioxygenase-like lactoylglutathione lyase family enzyme